MRHRVFQSTHPHGVRLLRFNVLFHPFGVSIHAPTRGATHFILGVVELNDVSIHAPTRGATSDCANMVDKTFTVSIHAPTRGATNCAASKFKHIPVSIHAPTRGATNVNIYVSDTPKFQSTHPHGVRHIVKVFYNTGLSFNPRTHTGCDGSSEIARQLTQVSIHAPTRGATGRYISMALTRKFQSTHPHGVRRY